MSGKSAHTYILKTGLRALLVLMTLAVAEALCAQKTVGDLTLHYELRAANNQHLDTNMIKTAAKTLQIRGGMCKATMVFNGFSQSIIYNQNGDKAYVLYHLNDQDYMSVLTKADWKKQYRKYQGMKVDFYPKETKKILGYTCIKATATLKSGARINMYYTPQLKTTVGANPYEFKQIPGLILEYEAQLTSSYKITFTATKIDFNPVPASEFIIPKEGYRLLDPSQLKQAE